MSTVTVLAPESDVVIETKASSWFYTDLIADFQAGREQWRVITEADYFYGLGSIPPLDLVGNSFLNSEPYDDRNGQTCYAGFTIYSGIHFARIIERSRFREEYLKLHLRLSREKAELYHQALQAQESEVM